MRRFICTDEQTAESIVKAAAVALEAIGCHFIVLAEDARGRVRQMSGSYDWARGTLENCLDDLQELREAEKMAEAEREMGDETFGPAEP